MIEQLILSLPQGAIGVIALLAITAISLAVLCWSADKVVDAAVEIARDMGIPTVIIGATIVSLGTTSPEAAVSVMAAIKGNSALSIGNGIGSLIADLALILGMVIVLAPFKYDDRLLKIQSRIVCAAAFLFLGLAVLYPGNIIHQWMGFVLLGGLVVYLYYSYLLAKKVTADSKDKAIEAVEAMEEIEHKVHAHEGRTIWIPLAWLGVGLTVLIGASDVLIPTVSELALRGGIPDAVIAATLVAVGTSTPELMTAISSVRKGHPELTLGNVMGADALNILFVIGASAAAVPLDIEAVFFKIQAPFMFGLLLLFQVYLLINRKHEFRRWQGVVMVIGYVLFVAAQFIFGGDAPAAH